MAVKHGFISTKNINRFPHPQYPHKDSRTEVELINNMYDAEVQTINGFPVRGEAKFAALYYDFLEMNVEVSEERQLHVEKLTEDEFESLKKRLAEECTNKENCDKCYIDEGDCRLLHGWKKEGDGFRHSYPLLGEYLPDLKKVILYKDNIDDASGKPTYNGVLSTYIHELFHAYFHYVTEQKQAEYNYIREVEEAMVEFSTLVFLRVMEKMYGGEWSDIFEWTWKSIGKKQENVGDLPSYGFGRYLFDSIPEDKAFDWINKYAERLGYIDEEEKLVKQYKQMVYPCYPSEPDKSLELLRKILFNTNNKPIKPRDVKGNRNKNMKNEAIVDSILCLLKEYRKEMTAPIPNNADLNSLKYLINQTIRAYDIPENNHHLSQRAFDRWNELSTEDIMKKHYKDKVVCDKLTGPVEYVLYTGASKTGTPTSLTKGSEFEFRKMFHEDHVIPVSMIFDEMVKMLVVDKQSIENLLNGMHMCVLLKKEDRKIGKTRGRSLDFDKTIEDVYKRYGISLCKLA